MKLKHFSLTLVIGFQSLLSAQSSNKEVLFSIDSSSYYSDEFARIYNKNIDLVKDESQKDLNQYLELFVGYKLKVAKAYKLDLNKSQKYISELESYRLQLAKNYLTDSKVTKELIDEAYNRSLKEVKASHILILSEENAAPADTLKAFNEIAALRKRVLAGEDFETLAQENSQDPSAKENKGSLGYFSAFRMVYPFESAAFSTKKGEMSKIIRTKFGYHLIKIIDVRDNRGEISVAHIMLMKQSDPILEEKSTTTINDIYKKIQQGEDFGALAKQFSEDKSTSEKGGEINRFASGQLSSIEFEDVAFSLSKEKNISKPFKSDFGWHIIKFIDRFPVKTLKEMESELDSKIKKDDRSRKITNSVNDKLRKEFPIKRIEKLYKEIQNAVVLNLKSDKWIKPKDVKYDAKLFTIKDKLISGNKFIDYIDAQQKGFLNSKLSETSLISDAYSQFVDVELNQYYNENLESKFPEFGFVMDEYREGLLLFDLMEKEIWEKSKNDTIGLEKFYEANKQKYKWKNRIDIEIFSSTKIDFIKNVRKMLSEKKSVDFIKEKLNLGGKIEVMDNKGVFELENEVVPKNVKFEIGLTDIVKQGDYYFVCKVNKLLPESLKTLDESKGKLINDYQQFLEENWVANLKKEFKIQINQEVFEKTKKEINKK